MDVLGLQFESALDEFEFAFAINYPCCYPHFESGFSSVRIHFPYEAAVFYPHLAERVSDRTLSNRLKQ